MDGVSELARMFGKQPEASQLTATGTVERIAEDGTIYASIPGGAGEFPVSKTAVEVTPGMTVNVRIENGRAFIDGSTSAPAISVQRANDIVAATAEVIHGEAEAAAIDAARAHDAADSAQKSADDAQTSADSALTAAKAANYGLSDVEKVVGTINWIAEHKTLSEDTVADPAKAYYVQDAGGRLTYVADVYSYSATSDASPQPGKTYYTLVDGYYVEWSGTAFEGGATYYERGNAKDPSTEGWYELDESIRSFLAAHVWMDLDGLNVSSETTESGGVKTLTTGWHMGSFFEMVRQGLSWFKLWLDSTANKMKLRLGLETSGHTVLDDTGMEVFKNSSTSVAFFGETARVGKAAGPRTEIQPSGVDLYGASDGSVNLAHFGYANGNTASSTSTAPYYTLGDRKTGNEYNSSSTYNEGAVVIYNGVSYVCKQRISTPEEWNSSHWKIAIGNYSVAEGRYSVASGYASHSEGTSSKATGSESHAEGTGGLASGMASHVEGQLCEASGQESHAEGHGTEASGQCSHAEGYQTEATEHASHAEGRSTDATGYASHAEGFLTKATASSSHAQNYYTIASSQYQTALGKYNVADSNDTYAAIIGNGTSSSNRSNALAVRWDGLVDVAGANTAYPLFIWSTAPTNNSTYPVSPCFVYCTADNGLYYCENLTVTRLNLTWKELTNGYVRSYSGDLSGYDEIFITCNIMDVTTDHVEPCAVIPVAALSSANKKFALTGGYLDTANQGIYASVVVSLSGVSRNVCTAGGVWYSNSTFRVYAR